jgi:hypothetical protein
MYNNLDLDDTEFKIKFVGEYDILKNFEKRR